MEVEKKATTVEEVRGVEEETKKEEAAASDVSLKELSKKLDDFAKERDWEMYHAPRNLLLAMVCSRSSCLLFFFEIFLFAITGIAKLFPLFFLH